MLRMGFVGFTSRRFMDDAWPGEVSQRPGYYGWTD